LARRILTDEAGPGWQTERTLRSPVGACGGWVFESAMGSSHGKRHSKSAASMKGWRKIACDLQHKFPSSALNVATRALRMKVRRLLLRAVKR